MLGRGSLREEHGGAIRDERCLLKEAWWRRKMMLEDEERKEESRSEEKSRRDRICKARVKEGYSKNDT